MGTNIRIDHALKKYGDNTIIPDLSLDVKPGEFFTLLGPSGCGKTTLLRMPAVREYSGFVNSGKLKRMKKTAILINTARSELVNKEDLLFALEKNMIGGYGADVSFHEPNTDDEFRNYPNVVITPHGGAVTSGAVDRMSSMAVENVLKYFR